MTRQQKMVWAVALSLSALIVLPVLIVMLARGGEQSGVVAQLDSRGGAPGSAELGVGFELQQLGQQAADLLAGPLADALRAGDLSLSFMAGLQRSLEQADAELKDGARARAAELYCGVLTRGESELARLALAEQARALKTSVFSELNRLEYLKVGFEQTYQEAVAQYNTGTRTLEAGEFGESVTAYKMAGAVLGDLEVRGLQQLQGLVELGQQALRAYDLPAAHAAFESVLGIDAEHAAAQAGLAAVEALVGIADSLPPIEALEQAGQWESALAAWQKLLQAHPQNVFLKQRLQQVQQRLTEREYQAHLQQADAAQAAGEYPAAIVALEAALQLKPSPELEQRLQAVRAQQQAARLEQLLASGYAALQAGDFEAARDAYRESVALAPESKEARTGLEKASTLYLASIRYQQNIETAAKYAGQGRYPLAAKFFNSAMSSRPSSVGAKQVAEEQRLRELLKVQGAVVTLTVESDKRTYVSIIGVLPPDRFRSTQLELFPDVYTVKGTREGYAPVEIEFKVDARERNPVVEVKCSEKL